MTNSNGNNMEQEEQRDLAAKVLYESGQFSYRDIGRLLGEDKPLPYRRVYNAVNNKNLGRKEDTTLTAKQVAAIKAALAKAEGLGRKERREQGLRQTDLAAKFKVHQTTISAIKRELTPKYGGKSAKEAE